MTKTTIKQLLFLVVVSFLSSSFLIAKSATVTPLATTPTPSPTTTSTPVTTLTPTVTPTPTSTPTPTITITITPTSTATPTIIPTKTPTIVTPVQNTAKLNDLKQRAIKEIDKRINVFNELIQKLESNQLINDDLKTRFKSELQKEIAQLNSLKVKIQEDNNVTALKNNVNVLIQSFKFYGFYNSQIRILLARENLNNAINRLNNLEPKLKLRIQELELNNKDVNELQKSYDKLINRIQDAQSQVQKIENIIKPLKVDNYPNNKLNLQEGRDILKRTQQSIKDALKEAENIINLLEKA